jgi:DNA replication protein DnaC
VSDFSAPFDEFGHSQQNLQQFSRGPLSYWARLGFFGLSAAALGAALLSAVALLVLRAVYLFAGPLEGFPWALKSAVPLIAVGFSYICLIITATRSAAQRLLGFLVGLAFILWGAEQFLSNQSLAAGLDDVVVFLFVLDLSFVIRENLGRSVAERRLYRAGIPLVKVVGTYNFAAQPSIDEDLFRELLNGQYIDRRENVTIVGNPGTGKTHLARALGYAACMQGKRVLFITASDLIGQLVEGVDQRKLRRCLKRFSRMDLIIIDEIGYVPFNKIEAELLFEVLSRGHERVSFVVTTTLPMANWSAVFGNEHLAQAVVGRLTDRAHLLEATGAPFKSPIRASF